jgi:hypothetical protein
MRVLLAVLVLLILVASAPPPFVAGQPAAAGPFGFVAADAPDFQAIRRAGGSVVKITADWSAIEADRGTYQWADLDAAIRAADAAGLAVTVVLAYTPRWAAIGTGLELKDQAIFSRQPVRRIEDWEAFVRKAVTRYRSRVKDWQVWTALSLPSWRGTPKDYVRYLTATRKSAKAVDPQSRVVLATPYGLDLVWVNRIVREAGATFDVVSLAPRGLEPEALLRPLRVLREQVLAGRSTRVWLEWDPRSSGERGGWSGEILKVAAIARALGVDRVDWVLEPSLAARALHLFATYVGTKAPTGQLISPRALALVFGQTNTAAVAWSAIGGGDLPLPGSGLTVISATGETRSPEGGETLALRPDPVILTDLDAAVVAAVRPLPDQGLRPPGARDFSGSSEVTARLGRENVEDGLYNARFRSRRNGALDVVEIDGAEAVRTNAGRDVMYVYFDVDDSFIFFVNRRYTVEVMVEVRGASAPRQLGFNLFYDSMSDYRFSEWQWVEAKEGWVTYTFRLPDAAFGNSWGWDFAINAAGNRREDLTIRSVTVRKSPSQ